MNKRKVIGDLRARAARTSFEPERAECLAKADKLEAKYFPKPPPPLRPPVNFGGPPLTGDEREAARRERRQERDGQGASFEDIYEQMRANIEREQAEWGAAFIHRFGTAGQNVRTQPTPDPRAAQAARDWANAGPEVLFDGVNTASGTGHMTATATTNEAGIRVTNITFTWQ